MNRIGQTHNLIFFEDKELEGKVLEMDENEIRFKTGKKKIIHIDRKEVAKITVVQKKIFHSNVDLENAQIKYGIRLGLNYSKINPVYQNLMLSEQARLYFDSGKWRNESSRILEYHFGIFYANNIKNKLSILLELNYSKQGAQMPYIFGWGTEQQELSYINMPILLGYSFHEKLMIQIGAGGGYLLNAKAKFKEDSVILDIIDSFNRFEIQGLAGLDYEINKWLKLGLRYVNSLNSIIEPEELNFVDAPGQVINIDAPYSYTFKRRNQSLQLSLFFSLVGFKEGP